MSRSRIYIWITLGAEAANRGVLYKNTVLKNFAIFFLNNVAGLRPSDLVKKKTPAKTIWRTSANDCLCGYPVGVLQTQTFMNKRKDIFLNVKNCSFVTLEICKL